MTNPAARRPQERLTSMPPPARAREQLSAGGRSRRIEDNIGRALRRAIPQHARAPETPAGRRSGDGPLSVRARLSGLKRDCARPATGTGGRCLANVHVKSRLTPETTAGTPARNRGSGGSLPGPDAGHPLHRAGGHDDEDQGAQVRIVGRMLAARPSRARSAGQRRVLTVTRGQP